MSESLAWVDYAPRGFAVLQDQQAWQDYAIEIQQVLVNSEWAFEDTAPRLKWAIPVNLPTQRIFVGILKATGKDDYEVPISAITIRLRDVSASYISCTIPDPVSYTSDILERIPGRIYIYAGELSAGVRHLEELIYANIQNVYFNEGSTNTLVIAGTRFITHQVSAVQNLSGVMTVSRNENNRYKIRCATDFFVKPTDIAVYGDVSFTADLVTHTITAQNAYMDVEGA